MRGSPCIDASVCAEGGITDTVCCRVLGKELPGVCYRPDECAARGAEYDQPTARQDGEERRKAIVRGAALALVAIGLLYMTTKPRQRP